MEVSPRRPLPAGGGEWERLTEGERHDSAPSWSPDAQFVAFARHGPPSFDILIYRLEERQAVPAQQKTRHT